MSSRVFAKANFFLPKNPRNGKICLIVFGNISWNQSFWHDYPFLVFVRVISKAITDQRRLQNIFLAYFVRI